MRDPEVNTKGFDAGGAVEFAANLKGRRTHFYGSGDNNAHPDTTMQVGPDVGHAAMNPERMMEFFIENLVLRGSP